MFSCNKCLSSDVFIKTSGNNKGLYCSKCGKWIKWLNKDEFRIVERQIESRASAAKHLNKEELQYLKENKEPKLTKLKDLLTRAEVEQDSYAAETLRWAIFNLI